MTTTIIIPQKGHENLTLNCIAGIRQHEPDVSILVVDDSQDNSRPLPKWNGVQVVANNGRGVTDAWNTGLFLVGEARHVILLNNDVQVLGPFVELLTQDQRAISGVKWRMERSLGPYASQVPREIIEATWLEGWCLSISPKARFAIGDFDRIMRLYFSDLDYQYRALLAGVNITQHEVPLRHIGHVTTHSDPSCRKQWNEDRAMFASKWRVKAEVVSG